MLELVGLRAEVKQRVESLSGGQRNRVSLAAALLGAPEVIVLDEPTVGLDPVLRAELWSLFERLAGAGAALIVSSHVMDEALRCDRLLLLRDGAIIADTTPDELLAATGAGDPESAFLAVIDAEGLPAGQVQGSPPAASPEAHASGAQDAPRPPWRGRIMDPGRILAVAGRVLRQLQHDPRSIALLLVVPALLVGLFAWLFDDQAGVFMPIVVFPQILVGGLLMPRDAMPEALQRVSDWLPLSYAVDAVNAVTVGDDGWGLWKPVIVIVGVSLASLAVAAATLRRRTS